LSRCDERNDKHKCKQHKLHKDPPEILDKMLPGATVSNLCASKGLNYLIGFIAENIFR
jgi:hypothetical protein